MRPGTILAEIAVKSKTRHAWMPSWIRLSSRQNTPAII